jgi:hypothetical protein
VCSDVDPALGSIRVNIIPADYHIEESKPPPNHTLDTAKYDCNATAVKCDITVIDRPIVRPWYPWDLTGSSGIPDGLVRVNDILDVVHHFFQDKPLPTPTP